MTAEEVEAEYAARSGVPVENIHKKAVPCACASPYCQGWKLVAK